MAGLVPLWTSEAGVRKALDHGADGTTRIVFAQDVAPILDRNKAMANHNDGYTPSRDMRRVASIPASLRLKWLNEEGWDCFDPANVEKLKQRLNSSDYQHIRTAPGRL